MRTPCNCGHRAVPDRTYRVPGGRPRQQCRRCRRLIVSDGLRTTAQPLPSAQTPEPEESKPLKASEMVVIGARIFRARPWLTNTDVYDELVTTYDCDLALATWISGGHAARARRRSGTESRRGRPSS